VDSTERGSRALWSWLFLDIYLPSIIAAIARGMLSIAIPLYLIAGGADPIYVGLGAASVAVGNLLMDLPGGLFLRTLGEGRLMKISLAVVASSSLGMALTLSPTAVIAFATIFGAGRSMWLLSRRYVITYYVPYSYRGRASSFIGMSERLGTFIGPAIVAAAVAHGYQGVFLTCSALASIAIIPSILSAKAAALQDIRGREILGDSPALASEEAPKLRLSVIAAASAANIAIQGVRSSRNILLAIIGKSLSMSDSSVSLAASVSGVLDVLGAYPAGLLMDKRGRSVAAAISFSIMAMGFAMLALSSTELLFYISSLAIGLGNGFGSGALITLGADIGARMEGRRGAVFLAFWQFVGDLGSASFPIIMGLVSSALGGSIASLIVSAASASIPPAFRSVRKALEGGHRL